MQEQLFFMQFEFTAYETRHGARLAAAGGARERDSLVRRRAAAADLKHAGVAV